MNPSETGLFFAIGPIFYFIVGIITMFLMGKISARLLIMSATLLVSIGMFFAGPSQILLFEDSILLMGIGQVLALGFGTLMCVPIIPEMKDSTVDEFPLNREEVSNLSSASFGFFMCLG